MSAFTLAPSLDMSLDSAVWVARRSAALELTARPCHDRSYVMT
jgi:hypothetical protein